jgi:hypothetical protein
VGQDDEPYLWLLRGLPEADERYAAEKKFASRLAVFLREKPDVKRPGKRPDQVLYNLLMLCAGLSCADELADPLYEVFERGQLKGTWRGVDVRSALKPGLFSNQRDSRLFATWEKLLLNGEHDVLPMDEFEFLEATRLMPESAARRGEPALDAIGKALRIVAERLGEEDTRENRFGSLARKVIDTYPGRPTWGRDLLLQALQQEWPKWAIEIIPGQHPEYVSRIIQTVRDSPYIRGRSVKGVIAHGFAEIESALTEEDPDAQSIKEAHQTSLKSLAVGA